MVGLSFNSAPNEMPFISILIQSFSLFAAGHFSAPSPVPALLTNPLTNRSMHALAHRTTGLVLVLVIMALAGVLLLYGNGRSCLVGLQVGRVGLHECLGDLEDVGNQAIQKITRHRFADNHSKDLDTLLARRERVI